jgi:hypothetical protein
VTLAGLPFLCFALAEGDLAMVLLIDGALAAQFAAMQGPLWFARGKFGLRLGRANEISAAEDRPHQFGIRQLLLWTAGVACVFGIGKWVLPENVTARFQRTPDVWQLVIVFVLLLVFHLLLPLPIIWGAFAHYRRGGLMLAARIGAALLLVGMVTLAEPWAFELLLPHGAGEHEIFYWLNAAHALWLLGVLLIARLAGYRLARNSPS